MLYWIVSSIALLICRTLFGLRVSGKKNIPKEGGFILASNHQSYLDPVVLGAVCSRKLNFMAKEELFCHPLFSSFLWALGSFPVKRDSADLSALKEAMRRLKDGKPLVLFPEGSRRFDGGPLEPHSGIGFLVSKLNVPVVPAFIKGTDIALPKSAKFIKPARVSVTFGRQIYIERRLPYQDIARLIMANIRHLSC